MRRSATWLFSGDKLRVFYRLRLGWPFDTTRAFAIEREYEVRSGRGVVGCPKDFILVRLQRRNPRTHIGGMVLRIVRHAQFSGKEYARQFGSRFLLRIVRVAETICLVQGGAVKA